MKENVSKSTRLIFIIIFMWVYFGMLGIYFNANLSQLAGYYASLTLFVSTYLWGEYKRLSTETTIFAKGQSSPREISIYLVLLLWIITGTVGILKTFDLNQLTVYFAALTPFVSSYIIYKTSKGKDLPIFNGESEKLKNDSIGKAGYDLKKEEPKKEEPMVNLVTNILTVDTEKKEEPKKDDTIAEDEVF